MDAFERLVLEGKRPAEVVAELELSTNSVYVAKHRVIGRLKERWADLADGLV